MFTGLKQELHRLHPFATYLAGILLLAAGYCLTGRLALLLAIPPGYATAVFPPAGIGLAVLLMGGYRLWPGVLLGSFALNYWISPITDWHVLILSLLIGSGAALQAITGAWLVRRFVGYPTALDNERHILIFFALGGPLSCLINASLSVGALYAMGIIESADITYSWWNWWVGDTLGVLLTTPLMLIFLSEPRHVWRRRQISVALPLVATSIIVVVLFFYASHWESDRLQTEFREQAEAMSHTLENGFKGYIEVVAGIERLFASSSHVSREEFHAFVAGSLVRHPGILALEWVPRITHTQRTVFEQQLRANGFTNFQITERLQDGRLAPAKRREEYFPVNYVEPMQGNAKALGFDLGSNALRRNAIKAASESGKVVATGQIGLVQDNASKPGFLLLQPVYSASVGTRALADGTERDLQGLVVGVFRVHDIIEAVLVDLDKNEMLMHLYDDSASPQERLMYGELESADKTHEARLSWSHGFLLAGRRWTITFTATRNYLTEHRAWQAWMVLAAGLLFASLLGAFLLSITGRASQIEALVTQRTNELGAILRNAVEAIITFDAGGRIESANSATEQLFGHYAEDLRGHRVTSLLALADREILERQFHDYWINNDTKAITTPREMQGRHHNGKLFPIEITISPLELPERRIFTAFIRDLSERKRVDRMKNEFISTVSHELRTPLTSILGSLGLVTGGASGKLPDTAKNLLEIAARNAERLVRLINDMLDIEKIENGNVSFNLQSHTLQTLVEQTLEAMQGYASSYQVNVVLRQLPEKPLTIHVDADRLAQVVNNLVSNAIKFSPAGSSVYVDILPQETSVRINVTDSGGGVPLEFQARLFERFAQADASDTRQRGGTGLGLSIAKAIVEYMGGMIGFNTTQGQGTTFYVVLPLSAAAMSK